MPAVDLSLPTPAAAAASGSTTPALVVALALTRQFHYDLGLEKFTAGLGFTASSDRQEFKLGDQRWIDVAFVRDGVQGELPPSANIIFSIKDGEDRSDDPLASIASFSRVGSGTSARYRGFLDLHTVELAAAVAAASEEYVDLVGELQIVVGGVRQSTADLPVRVWDDVNKATDGQPSQVLPPAQIYISYGGTETYKLEIDKSGPEPTTKLTLVTS